MGSLSHRDYDVRVSGRRFRLRVREGPDGALIVEGGGRSLKARRSGSTIEVEVGGRTYNVSILEFEQGSKLRVAVGGRSFDVEISPARRFSARLTQRTTPSPRLPRTRTPSSTARAVKGAISSPMPGKVVALKVGPGDKVKKGDVLLIIEAMKMENEIRAPRDGTVKEVFVSEGSSVSTGQPLLTLD